jgi:hypothetical protein
MLGFCAVAVGLSVVVVLGVYMGGGFTPQIDDDLVAAAGNSTAGSVSATAATAALTRLNLGGGGGGGGRQLQSGRSQGYSTLSALLGWAYFSAWSLSFYPQVWYNYQRQSVVGLSFDYQLLNILVRGGQPRECFAVSCVQTCVSLRGNRHVIVKASQISLLPRNDYFFLFLCLSPVFVVIHRATPATASSHPHCCGTTK